MKEKNALRRLIEVLQEIEASEKEAFPIFISAPDEMMMEVGAVQVHTLKPGQVHTRKDGVVCKESPEKFILIAGVDYLMLQEQATIEKLSQNSDKTSH